MSPKVWMISLVSLLWILPGVALGDPRLDPNDPVYRDIELWEAAGYVHNEPLFSPYPVEELRRILEHVAAVAALRDASRARNYLKALNATPPASGWTTVAFNTRDQKVGPRFGAGVQFGGTLTPRASGTVNFGYFGLTMGDLSFLPSGRRDTLDILEDNSKITVAGQEIFVLINANSQFTLQGDRSYFQAGILRRSFGPFQLDSPVLSSQAPQTANALYQWRWNRVRFTSGLIGATATHRFLEIESPTDGRNLDLNGDGIPDVFNRTNQVPGKLMYLQAITWDPAPWGSFTFFESVVTEPRLDLGYLVPLKVLWHAQGTAAYEDNSFLGVAADLRPAKGLRVPFVLYVDDLGFNDLAKFDFDTKYKLAGATAIQWRPGVMFANRDSRGTPDHSDRIPNGGGFGIDMVEASYEAVLPYMYTHAGTNPYTTEVNYRNYLHQGTSLGSSLLPNSDRIGISVQMGIGPAASVELFGSFMRHANASEGVLDQYMNDGGYHDNGREGTFVWYGSGTAPGENTPEHLFWSDADGDESFTYYTTDGDEFATTPSDLTADGWFWDPGSITVNHDYRFLQQEHIEQTWQAGINASLDVSFLSAVKNQAAWADRIRLEASYTFEYIQNPIEYVRPGEGTPMDLDGGGGYTRSLSDQVNHFGEINLRLVF